MPFDWMNQHRPHAIARGLYQFDELCPRNFDVFGAFNVPQSILEQRAAEHPRATSGL